MSMSSSPFIAQAIDPLDLLNDLRFGVTVTGHVQGNIVTVNVTSGMSNGEAERLAARLNAAVTAPAGPVAPVAPPDFIAAAPRSGSLDRPQVVAPLVSGTIPPDGVVLSGFAPWQVRAASLEEYAAHVGEIAEHNAAITADPEGDASFLRRRPRPARIVTREIEAGFFGPVLVF